MKIVIINPNSTQAQTDAIQKDALAFAEDRFQVETFCTPGAPAYIDIYQDAAQALPGMMELVKSHPEADAFIVACHCDPNLNVLKELTERPVVGIGESSMRMAAMLGHKFSVVSSGLRGVPNKEANIRAYGLEYACASLRGPGSDCTAADMAGKLKNAARHAVEEDLAEVIVLSAAGTAQLAKEMSGQLGVPVLDGVICALILAEGMCRTGLATSKIRRFKNGE